MISKEDFEFIEMCLRSYIRSEESHVDNSNCTSRSYYTEQYERIAKEESRIEEIMTKLEEQVNKYD